MEDSLSYLNAVSEATSALNQVTSLKEQALQQYQQKKEQVGSEFELAGEITGGTAGSYILKKVGGYISEKIGGTAGELAGKVGISESTVSKALSGDISGALEQGTAEVTEAATGAASDLVAGAQSMIGGALEGVTTTAETMAGSLLSQGQSVISEATQYGTGILGRVSSGLENIPSLSTVSINPESSLNDIYTQGLSDLRAQAGIDEASFREYTNVSLDNARQYSFNNSGPGSQGQEVEMTDFASAPTENIPQVAAAEGGVEGGEAVSAGAEGAESTSAVASVGETVGESVGEGVAAEVGGDVAAAVLGPIGGIVALGLGIWSFFHGEHEESSTPAAPVYTPPTLNPSAQFGAEA